MGKNKFKLLTAGIITGLTSLLLISTSVAWFGKTDFIPGDDPGSGIKGSVLTSYFHCGTGTEVDPFVITKPVHWENLIWLHNNIDDFYNAKGELDPEKGKGYFFQIGYDLDGDGALEVYNYTDDGYIVEGDKPYSKTTLNLKCFSKENKELIPLGSPQYPFIGTIDGNDFTISGFKVVGFDRVRNTSLEDIGIFGYVGPTADVHNIYFSDYTISTDNSHLNAEDDQYQYHTPHLSDASFFPHVCAGTLAGHIREAACFHDVYINRATIENTKNETIHADKLNTYGYYGVVEATKEGSSMGKGHDYSFKLDSSKVYQYMRENYSKINNQPIRTRNTEYDNVIYNTENPDITNLNGDRTLANHPISSGFSYVTSGMNSYNLIGDDPDNYSAAPHRPGNRNSYQGYNYSLSTLGYQPFDENSKSYKYKVVFQDGIQIPNDTVLTTESLTTALSIKETKEENRRYFDSTDNTWKFYHLDKFDRGLIPFKFKVSSSHDFNTGNNPSNDCGLRNGYAVLYIDGVAAQTWDLTLDPANNKVQKETSGRTTRCHFHINFSAEFDTKLTMGTHKVAFVAYENNNEGVNQARAAAFYCKNAGDSIRHTITQDFYNLRVTGHTLVIDENTADNTVFTLSTDTAVGYGNLFSGLSEGYEINSSSAPNDTGWNDNNRPIINNGDTTMAPLYGVDLNNPLDPTPHLLNSNNYQFTFDDGMEDVVYQLVKDRNGNPVIVNGLPVGIDDTLQMDEDGNYISGGFKPQASEVVYDETDPTLPVSIIHKESTHDAMWIATMEATKHIDVNAQTVYIADDPIFKGTDEEPGYNPKNIDIVGGGFQFSNNFVTIDGEDNRALTRPVTDSSYYGAGTGVGTKFYSTLYCPDSIVLMLSNVGGFNEDDIMGEITFVYDWTISNITGDWSEYLSRFKSMCFKKGGTGNNGYAYFQDVGMYEDDYSEVQGSTQWEKVGTMKLRRGVVENAAYCALDKDGKILCGYDINGNQLPAGSSVKNSQIATYVLVCGVKNSGLVSWWPISVNTRIRSIEFKYTAPEGFGGDFGSVEYRNATDRVEDTIFNMYYLCPENDQYRVTVEYIAYGSGDKRGKYVVTFGYYSSTNPYLSVNFYLYKIGDYDLFVNGVQICEDEYTAEGHQIVSSVQIE